MVMKTAISTALDELAAMEEELLEGVIAHVRQNYSSYRAVSDELLATSFSQNMKMAIDGVANRGMSAPDIMRRYAQIARTRFDLGIPAEDVVASMRFSIGLIGDSLVRVMERLDIGAETRLVAYRRLWDVSDAYTAVLVQEYRQHRLRAETHDHALKLGLLARLRSGESNQGMIDLLISRLGLLHERQYRAFIVEPSRGAVAEVYSALTRVDKLLKPGRGFAVLQGEAIFGASDELLPAEADLAMCFGPPAELARLQDSFAKADLVHRTSLGTVAGVHTYEKAGWRTLIDEASGLQRAYRCRFEAPLDEAVADPQTILDTVQIFVEESLDFAAAARRIHCHVNTVRYRVRRFETLTGASLGTVEDLVALCWYLEARGRHRH